ncbi:methyl-accepting chemotaxis protein [Saccharicrinis fermentans]|uniref:methyl-accepting chemotaxis protein n=1 Tax=Saccharicrinis fermentans TaxID=982 RepID=UPI001267A1F5|nr:methyl-accepting chemotaxis protein [Saccharicrinis fermentans]
MKKKLMLGFVISSLFIFLIGGISLIAINTARDASVLRAELEHQVALIRNVRMHLLGFGFDHAKYRTNIVRREFNTLLKTNLKLTTLLEDQEKSKMDSIQQDLKKRRKVINDYLKNAIVYDSITSVMAKKADVINSYINKGDNKFRSMDPKLAMNTNDKLNWTQKRFLYAKLRPGKANYKSYYSPVLQLNKAASLMGDSRLMMMTDELLSIVSDFENLFEKDKELGKLSDEGFSKVVVYTNSLIKNHGKSNEVKLTFIWNLVIVIALLGGLFVYFVSRITSLSTIRGIEKLNKLSLFVTEGKIGIRISDDLLSRRDEIGALAKSYENMLVKFRYVIGEIAGSAKQILSAGNELKSSSQSISVSSNEQAASLEEISGTVEEIVANIQQNVSNAQSTQQKARASAEGLRQLKVQNDKVFKSSVDIDNNTKIINEMALQTNILSLNAAVEAAIAGSYGKSFGVVAAEVKKLAVKSKDAAGDIVRLTKEGTELTKTGSKLAEKLLPEMEMTHDLVSEIAAASKEQQVGAEQINIAISALNNVSQENSSRAEQLSENAAYLSKQSDKLNAVISFFSVEEMEDEAASGNKLLSRIFGVFRRKTAKEGSLNRLE